MLDWQLEGSSRVETIDLRTASVVYTGSRAAAFQTRESFAGWSVNFQTEAPVRPLGYILHFAFHPGDVVPSDSPRFTVAVNRKGTVDLLGEAQVDLQRAAWQVVEIPLDDLAFQGPVESIVFAGSFGGTFYLDDVRLVPLPAPLITAVLEEHSAAWV